MKFVLRSFILEKNCVDLKNTLVCVPAFCCQKELRRGLWFLDWKGQGAICFREMSWWVGSWEGGQKRFGNDFITKKFVNKTGSVLVFLVPLVIRSPAPLGFLIFRVLICSLYFVVVAIAYAVFLLKWCSFFFFLFFSLHMFKWLFFDVTSCKLLYSGSFYAVLCLYVYFLCTYAFIMWCSWNVVKSWQTEKMKQRDVIRWFYFCCCGGVDGVRMGRWGGWGG